jgi:hypothetical protein
MVMFTCNKGGCEWEDPEGGSAPGKKQAGIQKLAAGLSRISSRSRIQVEHQALASATALNGKPPESVA